jgi:hypothetical protein
MEFTEYALVWWDNNAVTQHTTTCCSMQVVDITLAEHHSARITFLRGYNRNIAGPNTNQSRADKEMLPQENISVLSVITTKR